MFVFPVSLFDKQPVVLPPEQDLFSANRILLLSGNGVNNGTVFIDNSIFNRNIELVGSGVTTVTDQYKWNGSSIFFPGSSANYLRTNNTSNLNFSSSDNFTIEAWIYRAISGTIQSICSNISGTTGKGFNFAIFSDNKLFFQSDGGLPNIFS